MKIFKVLFAIIMVATVASCSPLESDGLQVKTDDFTPTYIVTGIKERENPFNGIAKVWNIRSFISKKPPFVDTNQLYLEIDYTGEWKNFYLVADETANPVPLTQIAKHVGDCSFGSCNLEETVGVAIKDSTLRKNAANGFKVKLSAMDGSSFVIPITAQMIRVQLATIDSLRRSRQTKQQVE